MTDKKEQSLEEKVIKLEEKVLELDKKVWMQETHIDHIFKLLKEMNK